MKLPNAQRAVIDLRKLRDYALNPNHGRGRHKARVFFAALGLTADDAENFRQILINVALEKDADIGERDHYGQRFVIDFEMSGPTGRAVVRSGWIIRAVEDFPRLTSCYVIEESE